MKVRKTFVTLASVSAIAIAGTGVASAQDDLPEGSTPTAGSAELSQNRDVFGSITGADDLGSYTDGQIDYSKVLIALASVAGGAASIGAVAEAYDAVVGASDTWQEVVSNTTGWLEANGFL
ncbi:MAG: hypothetical protein ACTH1D_11640 [Mycobacteriaceae bacterium]|uniref:hypothetical protein n=1 Tax=Corynebacterium sp. TaxID=1720 RepID=UPI003F9A7AAC